MEVMFHVAPMMVRIRVYVFIGVYTYKYIRVYILHYHHACTCLLCECWCIHSYIHTHYMPTYLPANPLTYVYVRRKTQIHTEEKLLLEIPSQQSYSKKMEDLTPTYWCHKCCVRARLLVRVVFPLNVSYVCLYLCLCTHVSMVCMKPKDDTRQIMFYQSSHRNNTSINIQ